MRYDRARTSLDRHTTYIVAAYVAGLPGKADAGRQSIRLAATGQADRPQPRRCTVRDPPFGMPRKAIAWLMVAIHVRMI